MSSKSEASAARLHASRSMISLMLPTIKEYGADMWTQKVPDKQWLAWVEGEIAKEAARNASLSESKA